MHFGTDGFKQCKKVSSESSKSSKCPISKSHLLRVQLADLANNQEAETSAVQQSGQEKQIFMHVEFHYMASVKYCFGQPHSQAFFAAHARDSGNNATFWHKNDVRSNLISTKLKIFLEGKGEWACPRPTSNLTTSNQMAMVLTQQNMQAIQVDSRVLCDYSTAFKN